ncbi:MAG: site-specific integrase, partial [Caulobacteraceae bacterium]|nr:site-specific integrase [Caulobacteraceae bacterium]
MEPAEISRMILGARSALRQNVAARFEVLARLGFEHGLRIGEICSLRDDAIGRSIRVRRKGGNRDDRPVGVALGTAIDTWRQLRPGATDGSLLVALDGPTIGRAWAARSARAHLATVALRTLGRSVPPHALRHAGATRVLEATGGNVRALQSWGRWSSPQIAMRYDDDVQDPAGELAAMLAA